MFPHLDPDTLKAADSANSAGKKLSPSFVKDPVVSKKDSKKTRIEIARPRQRKVTKTPPMGFFMKKVENILEGYLISMNEEGTFQALKDLNLPERFLSNAMATMFKKVMDSSESDRDHAYDLLLDLKKEEFVTHPQFLEFYKLILDLMGNFELSIRKTYVADFVTKSVCSGALTFAEVAEPIDSESHFPFLLLVLRGLSKVMDNDTLADLFEDSKVDLLKTLPKAERFKTRMADFLEERGLGFLFPILKIQTQMAEQLRTNGNPEDFFAWIDENVSEEMARCPGFITAVITVLVRFITQEASKDADDTKTLRNKEKDLLLSFKPVITKLLRSKMDLQLIAVYAVQSCWFSLDCPKVMLLRWFVNLFDLEMIEQDVFLKWKEDIEDDYPAKGQALFQVNQWLIWLEDSEDEDEEEEEEESQA